MNFDQIRNLKKGWCDGDGETVDERILYIAQAIFSFIPDDCQVSPTSSGGIDLSWKDDSVICTIEDDLCMVNHFEGEFPLQDDWKLDNLKIEDVVERIKTLIANT